MGWVNCENKKRIVFKKKYIRDHYLNFEVKILFGFELSITTCTKFDRSIIFRRTGSIFRKPYFQIFVQNRLMNWFERGPQGFNLQTLYCFLGRPKWSSSKTSISKTSTTKTRCFGGAPLLSYPNLACSNRPLSRFFFIYHCPLFCCCF